MLKGLLHIHSSYSYDGKNTLEEVVDFAKKKGYKFLFLTEHSDFFNADKFKSLVNDCNALSGNDFIVFPGIEYRCDNNLHLLCIGIKTFLHSNDPVSIIKKSQEEGGVTIIAHPYTNGCKIPEDVIKIVDGIEIWNAAKDGRFFPHYLAVKLFNKYKKINPDLIGVGGLDLHSLENFSRLEIRFNADDIRKASIGKLFKQEVLKIRGKYFYLSSDESQSNLLLISLFIGRMLYEALRKIRDKYITGKFISPL